MRNSSLQDGIVRATSGAVRARARSPCTIHECRTVPNSSQNKKKAELRQSPAPPPEADRRRLKGNRRRFEGDRRFETERPPFKSNNGGP